MSFDLRITPLRPDLAADFLQGQVEAQRFVAGRIEEITVELADLHKAPQVDAELLTQGLMGERVTVYDEAEGFVWVQLQRDGYVGYLPAASLRLGRDLPFTHKVCAPRTFLYPDADLKRAVLDAVPFGGALRVVGEKGSFYKIDGERFVYQAHCLPIDAFVGDYSAIPEMFLHVPYLWGGKTFTGIDCSGLVQIALQAGGIKAPRDSDMLFKIGAQIAINTDLRGLRRGDLVFWRGHVGMMLDEVRLIHANGFHMQVTIEPLALAQERILAQSGGQITGFRRIG